MKRARPGYTLIELLIVVILIGIITALAAPQVSQSIANQSVSDAATEVMVIAQAARTMAAQNRLAYRIYLDTGESSIVRLDRSGSNFCEDMPGVCNTDAPDYGGPDCGLRVLDFQESRFLRRGVRIPNIEIGDGSVAPLHLCVTPSGRTFQRRGGVNWDRLSQPVEIYLDRTEDDESIGVVRQVYINTRGIPRLTI